MAGAATSPFRISRSGTLRSMILTEAVGPGKVGGEKNWLIYCRHLFRELVEISCVQSVWFFVFF